MASAAPARAGAPSRLRCRSRPGNACAWPAPGERSDHYGGAVTLLSPFHPQEAAPSHARRRPAAGHEQADEKGFRVGVGVEI